MTKRLADMNDDELNAYIIEARAYAEDKARADLKAERAKRPHIYTENGVSYMRRTVPLERRSKREPAPKWPRRNRWAEFKEWLFRYE